MNIAMGETEVFIITHLTFCCTQMMIPLQEYVNGQLKCKYGDCFIRGNNGRSLCHI